MTQSTRTLRWKWWAIGRVAAVFPIVGGIYLVARDTQSAKAAEVRREGRAATVIRVEVIRPRKGEMDRTSTQPGTVQAFESVEMYAGVSGYLRTLSVDIGDAIKHGQPLATVDVPELEKEVQRRAAALDQATARVAQMKAHVISAKAELEAARSSRRTTKSCCTRVRT